VPHGAAGDAHNEQTQSSWVAWKVNDQALGGLPMERPYEGQNGDNPVLAKLSPGESSPGIFQSDDYLSSEFDHVRSGIGLSTYWAGRILG
jgi:hypothetical protein